MVALGGSEETVEISLTVKLEAELGAAALRDVGVHQDTAAHAVEAVEFRTGELDDPVSAARHASGYADAGGRFEMRRKTVAVQHSERNRAVREIDGKLSPVGR